MKRYKTKEEKMKKMDKIFKEFKMGQLNIGQSPKKVKNRKQAVAIALSVTGQTKKKGGK